MYSNEFYNTTGSYGDVYLGHITNMQSAIYSSLTALAFYKYVLSEIYIKEAIRVLHTAQEKPDDYFNMIVSRPILNRNSYPAMIINISTISVHEYM